MRYRKDFYRQKAKGSFTVEAALIIPMILGVIVLFIHIAMFCHDRCAIEHVCQMTVAKAVYEKEDIEKKAEEYLNSALPGKLICNWDTEIMIGSDENHLTAEVEAVSPIFGRTFIFTAAANKHFSPKY